MLALPDTTVLMDHLRGRPAVGRFAGCAIGAMRRVRRRSVSKRCTAASSLGKSNRRASSSTASGRIRWDLRKAGGGQRSFAARGRTLAQADCLIAAAAHLAFAVLIPGNPKDFPMEELRVEHRPVGE